MRSSRHLILFAASILALQAAVPPTAALAAGFYTPAQTRATLEATLAGSPPAPPPEYHPDYVIHAVAQALAAERAGDPRKVIQLLEPLLIRNRYQGLSSLDPSGAARLWVGVVGSFGFWRELIFLALGRAYYATGQDDSAVGYFESIPDSSSYSALARIGAGWSLLRRERFEEASKNLDRFGDRAATATDLERREMQLQRAYWLMESGKIAEALRTAAKLQFPEKQARNLATLQFKLIAQANLNLYLASSPKLPYAEKKARLEQIIHSAERVPVADRDSEFSVLVTESYWHLASVYRIDDPLKHRQEWIGALNRANEWITPWADRAKPVLSEDAMFLAVAVLWEQEKFDPAIPRLNAIRKQFPQGEYREDVCQLLGDHYYDAGEYAKAILYFGELARLGSAEKASYGVYKAAWSFYNLEDKWKALRHLERLVVAHHRAKNAGSQLVSEAEKDLLLIMAELLPYKTAFGELDFIGFEPNRRLELQGVLGVRYKEIGRYEESIGVLQALLSTVRKGGTPHKWLEDLLATLLVAGRRDLLAAAVERYELILPAAETPELKAANESLARKIIAVTLTVHREAKKTDDPDIWKAADGLYAAFIKHHPDAMDGDFHYYGAQRKEQLGLKLEAIQWYRKAAEAPKYENALDSALSVLRIVKDLTADPKLDPRNTKFLSDEAEWYIAKFGKTPQRKLAELLFLELAYKSGNLKKPHEYVVKVLKEDKSLPAAFDLYQALNRKLYEGSHWDEAYSLATAGLQALGARDSVAGADAKPDEGGLRSKLRSFQQESAFQAAFAADRSVEKSADNKDSGVRRAQARQWYERSIHSPVDPLIALKAWHNLMVSYEFPQESPEFQDRFQKFEKSTLVSKPVQGERAKILFDIYRKAADAWESEGEPLRKALAMTQAAELEEGTPVSQALHWESAQIFGTYYQVNRMKIELEHLRVAKSDLLARSENQLVLARLLFWNRDESQAWSILKGLIAAKAPLPGAWVLTGDLLARTRSSSPVVYGEVREHLLKNQARLADNYFLQGHWDGLLAYDDQIRKIAAFNVPLGRAPASTANPLKAKVDRVGDIVKAFVASQSSLKPYVGSPFLTVDKAAFCAAPELRNRAIDLLEKVKSQPAESPQWPEFLKRLDVKIAELRTGAASEKKICDEKKEALAFMTSTSGAASPLCPDGTGNKKCFPDQPEKTDIILKLERDWKKAPPSRMSRIRQYLEIGAWAPAERVAYSTSSQKERSLLLGFIRMAMADFWNAGPLLEDAKQEASFRSPAQFLLASIAWYNGVQERALQELGGVSAKGFEEWQKDLIDRIKLGPRGPK